MRWLLFIIIAVLLSVGGTFVMLQPAIHDRIVDLSDDIAQVVRSAAGAPAAERTDRRGAPSPTSSPDARGIEDIEPETAEHVVMNSVFWFNQGLSLFYTLLGAIISEVIRALADRRKRLPA